MNYKYSNRTLFLCFMLFSYLHGFSQLTGWIQDENGESLPYVSIYVKGTSTGSTSNIEGYYQLPLDPGTYEIVYRFIGYQTVIKRVTIANKKIELNIQFAPESYLLDELVIRADAEDPAYRIIREAIKKREFYRKHVEAYSCDVYVKGNQKILDAPKKFMGIDIGDLDGALDTNRQGIVYLSESVSKLYFQSPDQFKEIVNSSKISGDDRGYSFNSAKEMEFDFYKNTIALNRQIVNPIADNAMAYYKYELIGKFKDDQGRIVNNIKVIPRRDIDPAFYGNIYIYDDLWNIHSLELGASAKATQVYLLDSLNFSQSFIPLGSNNKWRLFNNTVSFKLSAFGFVLRGSFAAVYSNYNIEPTFEKGFFDRYVHIVEKESNKRDSIYWDSIRPVLLTIDEITDYHRKDSIQLVRNDPAYIDSVDRVNNVFKVEYLLSNYSHRNRNKHSYYSIDFPFAKVGYNTVQGLHSSLAFDYRKYFDEDETRRILIGAKANYGFSEKTFRSNAYISYRPSRMGFQQIGLSGGSDIYQIDKSEPIPVFWNTLYTLFLRENYARYYDAKYVNLSYIKDLESGVRISSDLRWEDRSFLENNSDYSFFKKDKRAFFPNKVEHLDDEVLLQDDHQIISLSLNARIRFNQEFVLYPDRRFSTNNESPTLNVSVTQAFKIAGTDVSYGRIAASLEDDADLGVRGKFHWYANVGVFYNKSAMSLMDYRHFQGSEILFIPNGRFQNGFFLLPYYKYSTNRAYFQLHLDHEFNGFILDRIPGINRLGFGLIVGAKYLHSGVQNDYYEVHVGLDNIGWNFFRFLRVDGVWSFASGESNFAWRLGIKLN